MIVTEKHPNCSNIVVFDCVEKKTVGRVQSFDTETKEAIIFDSYNDESGITKTKIVDGEIVMVKKKLPNCILIDCKKQEIIK